MIFKTGIGLLIFQTNVLTDIEIRLLWHLGTTIQVRRTLRRFTWACQSINQSINQNAFIQHHMSQMNQRCKASQMAIWIFDRESGGLLTWLLHHTDGLCRPREWLPATHSGDSAEVLWTQQNRSISCPDLLQLFLLWINSLSGV